MPMSSLGCSLRWLLLCPSLLATVLVMSGFVMSDFSECAAQPNLIRKSTSGVHLPTDRKDSRGIQQAKELIQAGEFSQAIRFLDDVLAREEDSFVLGRNDELTGLKEAARKLLRGLPPEGLRIYETTYGPVARRLLNQSTAAGKMRQLHRIAQRYFHTPAGHEAALLFALQESDQGRHLTAALTYQQLLETPAAAQRFQPQLSLLAAASWLAAGNSSQATSVLDRLGEQGSRNLHVSGQRSPLQASGDGLLDWLLQTVGTPITKAPASEHQWLTARGNSARHGQTDGGLPHLRERWQVRLLEHHSLETVHDEMAAMLARQNKSRLPAATPLAVGDYVITRSAHGLVAINFKTGKRVWQAQPQREPFLQSLLDTSQRKNENNNGVMPAQDFARMIWEDYLYNTTSSDGKHVYVIRDLPLPRGDRLRAFPFMQQPQASEATEADTNRLCAYDLPTEGKLIWEIDGKVRQDELQGAFFLGAPVTVGQSLYCLVEIKSETAIYLVALDRETGVLQWRQQLADLERGIALDAGRRLQAVMPSYDSGMLVCPTGSGVVVGVDLAKQALAWAFRYQPKSRQLNRAQMLQRQMLPQNPQWVHSAPVLVDERVLLAQPESDMLHCLDLRSGKLLWKHPRNKALFLAGVEGETVLLVGNRHVSALRLADGKPAWSSGELELPSGSVPTGSGFFTRGKYFLPLSNAQVVAIDVTQGNIVAKASSRDGQQLGNLVCYQGAVISQTGRYLDCFEQVDVLRAKSERRRLEDPTDFEALRTLGEIAYNEGQLADAIQLLSDSYESEPRDLRTKEVLSEALVTALDEDFSRYQDRLPLLSKIEQGSPVAQLTFLRLQSQGLLELGQVTEAFDICLTAFDRLSVNGPVELTIRNDHKLSAKRWLATQVALTWDSASSEQREQLAEQFAALLAGVTQSDDLDRWQHFYDCFGALELAGPFGVQLATRRIDQGEVLAGQQLLLKLLDSKGAQTSRAAIAVSSRLLHEADLPRLAMEYDTKLRGALADQECLPGMTGLECLEQWTQSSLASASRWPYGKVVQSIQESPVVTSKRGNRSPRTGIQLERSDAVLGNCNVMHVGMISGRNREIKIQDSLGRNFFTAKLDRGSQAIMNSQGSVYGVSRGNLLILSLGRQVMAFDTLSSSGQALWRLNTTSSLQYLNQYRSTLRGRLGRGRPVRSQSDGNWIGIIGPVTADSCVLQIEERLVCVDSLSGEIRWSRDNIPRGCDLYGDEHQIFAVPKDSRQSLIFSTCDGRSLGETATNQPVWKERLATVGGSMVSWRARSDQRRELFALDSAVGEVLWKYDFDRRAQVDVVQNRFAAVVEPKGHCTIIDLHSGQPVVDQVIESNASLNQVYLLVGSEHFLLAVQRPAKADPTRYVTGFNKTDFTPRAFAGQVYLFDRLTGRAVWSRAADVRGLPLMLAQPVDLPVVAFVGNVRRRDKQGSRQELAIMLLEKSTGRQLFRNETLPTSSHHCFLRASKDEPNEMVVEMLKRQITLKFTSRPRAPEPPAMSETQRKAGAGSNGLQKLGAKLLRGG